MSQSSRDCDSPDGASERPREAPSPPRRKNDFPNIPTKLGAAERGPTTKETGRISEFAELIGKELGPTQWLEVDQERIDGFAKATDDPQWIHTDPVRAAEGPFGTTIAHGFLTLSLCVPLMAEALGLTEYRIGINYGVNKVRFPAAVPSGSRIRARFTVQSVEEVAGGDQGIVLATVEREGGDKPVCVAEFVARMLR